MDRQGRQRLLIGSYLGMVSEILLQAIKLLRSCQKIACHSQSLTHWQRDGGGGDFPCTHIGSFNFIEEGVFSIPRGLKLKFTTIGKVYSHWCYLQLNWNVYLQNCFWYWITNSVPLQAVSMFLIVYAIISPVDEQLGHNLSILGTLMYAVFPLAAF